MNGGEESLPRLLIWMNMPSHHQRGFFEALGDLGVDLRVAYYGTVAPARAAEGWEVEFRMHEWERTVMGDIDRALSVFPDWRHRVHIVPGYGSRVLRKLVRRLAETGVRWAHWSERARPGWRWIATYPLKRWYARLVNRTALAAFGTGRLALEDFVKWGIAREKTAFLPYAPAIPEAAHPDPVITEFLRGRLSFLYVGRLEHAKGTDVLLPAFARAARGNPDWALVLVGRESADDRYRRLVRKEGIEDQVLFRGVVASDAVPSCFAATSVCILPSRGDGWGMVLSEGAALGKPLIGSDACGASEHLIREGRNGFVVPAGSVEGLASRMKVFIERPELIPSFGAESKAIYQDFTPVANARRLVGILSQKMAEVGTPGVSGMHRTSA